MALPLHVLTTAIALTFLTAQAPDNRANPISTASIAEEIVGENCYVSHEPVIDEKGRKWIHTEVLCD